MKIEVAFSNVNLPPHRVFTQGIEETRELLAELACNGGLEYQVVARRDRLSYEIARLALAGEFKNVQDGIPLIGSLHDTWWHLDAAPNQELSRLKKIQRVLGRQVLRETADLTRMRQAQNWTGQQVDAVVFPDVNGGNIHFTQRNAPFRAVLFQTAPEVMTADHAYHPEYLRGRMAGQGLTGVVLATTHYRRNGKRGLPRLPVWWRTWPALLRSGLVHEVHLETGRSDMEGFDSQVAGRTVEEMNALIAGTFANTEAGDMMACVYEHWVPPRPGQALRIVRENPAASLSRRRFITYKDFRKMHRAMTEGLEATLPKSI